MSTASAHTLQLSLPRPRKAQVTQEQILRVLAKIDRATPDRPVSSRDLEETVGINERQLRGIVEDARRSGQLICNGIPGGYFKARSWEDYRPTFERNIGFALSMLKTQHQNRKLFAEGSESIYDFLDPATERILNAIAALELPKDNG